MVATMLANATLWGFLAYVKRNPYKSVGGMTFDDLQNMADMYIAENVYADSELSSTASYTDCEFPGTIQAADTVAAGDQADYPEKHKGS